MNKIIITTIAAFMMLSCTEKKETKSTKQYDSTSAQAIDRDAIHNEIQQLEDGYAAAMNARNSEGLKDYYAPDAQSYITDTEVITGKPAILEAAKGDFNALPPQSKLEYTMTDLFISDDGDQVVETGSYRASKNSGVLRRKGNFMAVFEKRDGKYVCVRDIDSPQ